MKIVAGLGNPGAQYQRTRHNLGFLVADALAQRWGIAFGKEKFGALIAEARVGSEKVLLMKPQTFMNRSGQSIAQAARNGIEAPGDLIVVVDEVQLPLGRVRIRKGGSAGGHNGLKSIIEHVGTKDFPRVRLGIGGNGNADLSDHVLGTFRPDEYAAADDMVSKAADALELLLTKGIDAAMNEYNRDAG